MSETTTTAEGGVSPPDAHSDPANLQEDNQVETNDNQVEANDNQQTEEQQQRQSREDRRIAQLSARLAAETRERERLQAESEAWRRQLQGQQPQLGTGEETEDQRVERLRQQVRAEVEVELRKERFHAEGAAEYGAAWQQKCQDLIS